MLSAGVVRWRTSMNSMIKSIKVWIESIRFFSSSFSPFLPRVVKCVAPQSPPPSSRYCFIITFTWCVILIFFFLFLRSIYVLCFFPRACDKGKFPCRNRTTWYRKRTKEKRVCISDFFRELRHKIRIMFRNIINEHKKRRTRNGFMHGKRMIFI